MKETFELFKRHELELFLRAVPFEKNNRGARSRQFLPPTEIFDTPTEIYNELLKREQNDPSPF